MIKNKNSWMNLSLIGVTQVIATMTMLASVISIFDQHHRFIELFVNFKLQYFISSLLCAGLLILYKNYKFALLMLAIGAINSVYIIPWYFSDSKNAADELAELTLLHSNVYRDNNNYEKLIELVNQENPDIFVLQEVNEQWLTAIQELETDYPYQFKTPRNDNFGIAMYSKLPFESVKKIKWIKFNVPSIEASVSIDGQIITIITTHPLPPINDEYYQARNGQINKIAEISRAIKGPLVVIGDLNITVWSNDYKILETNTPLRNARNGFGVLPTWPAQFKVPFLMIPIDHCLVSSEFIVKTIKTGNDIGSDHLPLIIELGLIDSVR